MRRGSKEICRQKLLRGLRHILVTLLAALAAYALLFLCLAALLLVLDALGVAWFPAQS